jgi:hypothetical protein
MVEMKQAHPQLFCADLDERKVNDREWWTRNKFGKSERVSVRWHLISVDVIPETLGRNWSDQQTVVESDIESIPWAREVVYATILQYLTHGRRLLERYSMRCADTPESPRGHHVRVGPFSVDRGLLIMNEPDWTKASDIGLAGAWNPIP